MFGKHFSFKQRLNSFDRIGDSSGCNCFKTTTGIGSGPVALPDSRLEMSLETSLTVTLKSGIVEGIREAKSGSGWLESSSVEFVAKFLVRSLALSEEEEIT